MTSGPTLVVHRRTVLAAAAWAAPAVLAGIHAPLSAASTEKLTLKFDQNSYTVAGCSSLSNVVVTATTADGSPAVGVSVTVTLPSGYTFSGGATTSTGTTDGSGAMSVPTIFSRPVAEDGTLVATSGTSSTGTAAISLTPTYNAYVVARNGIETWSYGSLPSESRPIGGGYSRVGNDIWYHDGVIATDQGSAQGYIGAGPSDMCDVVSRDGGAQQWRVTQVVESFGAVPAGSTAVGSGFFLAPDGQLWHGNQPVTSGVASASANHNEDGSDYCTIVYDGGIGAIVRDDVVITRYTDIPTGSRALTGGYFLDPSRQLRYGSTLVTTAPASVSAYTDQTGQQSFAAVIGSDGGATVYLGTTPTATFPDVPKGSTAYGADYFQSPSGVIWYKNAAGNAGAYVNAFIGADGGQYAIYAPLGTC